MTSTRLTEEAYWDATYGSGASGPLAPHDFRHLNDRRLLELLESLSLEGKRVLEIGAGNSAVLSFLARSYGPRARFTGLDYSAAGCRLLASRAERERAEIEVLQQDLFAPAPELLGRFDVVFSIGVVEHFTDLSAVLAAMAGFLAPAGVMFTLIPNMAGALGSLTRRFNRRVYDLHLPHRLSDLVAGHQRAGLEVSASGSMCSTNFGVLSSCFRGPGDRGFRVYRWLSRLTKALWWVEARFGDLPHTRVLSPYLYAVSRLAS